MLLAERWEPVASPISDRQRQHILGLSLSDIAAPVARLSDSEDTFLALIHPLVQVYTIPKTWQLAYVGHVRNLKTERCFVCVFLAGASGADAFCDGPASVVQEQTHLVCTFQNRCVQGAAGF